jgi:AcrR family transcriptional regulator
VSQSTAQTPASARSAGRPMRADARRNYERLIAAAREMFREGDTDTSLEAVARRAGVGIGTLYRHFPNRLALLEGIYGDEVDAFGSRAQALLDDADPWDGLAQLLYDFVDYAATKRALFQELVDAVGRDSDLLTHSREVIQASFESALTKAQNAGAAKAEVTASDLMRLVGGCTMMPGVTDDDQRRRMLDVVLAGIRA